MRSSAFRRSLATLVLTLPASACGGDTGPREPAPATAAVSIGNDFFRSDRNGTENRAVDTVRAGGTVTWTWIEINGSHSVRSQGTLKFTGSDVMSTQGSRYGVTFTRPGTYDYDCGVHGQSMVGRVVVE